MNRRDRRATQAISTKATAPTDPYKGLLTVGSAHWPTIIGPKRSASDAGAWRRAAEEIERIFRRLPMRARQTAGGSASVGGRMVEAINPVLLYQAMFSAKWVDGGCRTLCAASRKYFAAMAKTDIGSAGSELHIPWPCFVVQLPDDVIVDGDGRTYRLALFGQSSDAPGPGSEVDALATTVDVCSFHMIIAADGAMIYGYHPNRSLADILFVEPSYDNVVGAKYNDSTELIGSDRRIIELVKAATVGLLFTMQHTPNWTPGPILHSGVSTRTGPPRHRSIIIGRPIDVDVVADVRAEATGAERGAPSVQSLVRGHLKRQVVGVGRTGRKVIWVEPYWRGPEDAPILARPYQVGTTKEVKNDG